MINMPLNKETEEKQNWYYGDTLWRIFQCVDKNGGQVETLKSYHNGTSMEIFLNHLVHWQQRTLNEEEKKKKMIDHMNSAQHYNGIWEIFRCMSSLFMICLGFA